MTKSNSTKRALVSSIMAIVVCVAMLLGTTFAWFTDTAQTGVNKIQAGTLNVGLEYATAWNEDGSVKTWSDAENKTMTFKTADNRAADEIFWEPGCTYELPEMRVVNNGNLALKYKIVITGINGSAKLNEVIDWTINNADMGKEYSLTPDEKYSDVITVKGHMQESAGNDYQGESIDGIGITVYAVQDTVENDSYGNDYDKNADGTPQFDTWFDNVSATETVVSGKDTVIKDREVDPNVVATIPANSTTAETLKLVKTKTTTPANINVITGTEALSADVSLVDQNGNKVTAKSGKFFTVQLKVGTGLNVIDFYHNSAKLTKVANADAVSATNDTYYYDSEAGIIIFSTDDFSPFTVVVSDSDFNGGDGTQDAPYLIATGDQAYAMRNAKGYFKLVNDVVVSNEIYLSGKTYTLDLNGHSIKLVYADGVKPNNGSVLNVAGKKSNLTINDSSAAQTGAVYGSDQSFTNKVTAAVRAGNYSKITINGGHFYGTSEGTSCIFICTSTTTSSKATVTINGGTFETASPLGSTYYVINHQDGASAGCTVTVNGGTFKNYNPGVTSVDPVNAKTGKIALGDGCTTTSKTVGDDVWYTVSK